MYPQDRQDSLISTVNRDFPLKSQSSASTDDRNTNASFVTCKSLVFRDTKNSVQQKWVGKGPWLIPLDH